MPKYVCLICVFLASWAHSRVVCGEDFGSFAISLDGLHGSGVKHPLTHRSLSIPPCLACLTPLSLALVQGVHTQQQAVVHDLKTLQHLKQVSKHAAVTRNEWKVHWRKLDYNEQDTSHFLWPVWTLKGLFSQLGYFTFSGPTVNIISLWNVLKNTKGTFIVQNTSTPQRLWVGKRKSLFKAVLS